MKRCQKLKPQKKQEKKKLERLWNWTFKLFHVWQTLDPLRTIDPLQNVWWVILFAFVILQYTLPTLRLRTKNGAPQFPTHIFKAKQSIDLYENVCKLFSCKTHTSLVPSLRGFSWEVWNGKEKLVNLSHFAGPFPEHSPWTQKHWPQLWKLCCQILRARKQPPQGQTAKYIFSVSQRWKISWGQLIQDPGDLPLTLSRLQNTHVTCIFNMHTRRRAVATDYTRPHDNMQSKQHFYLA